MHERLRDEKHHVAGHEQSPERFLAEVARDPEADRRDRGEADYDEGRAEGAELFGNRCEDEVGARLRNQERRAATETATDQTGVGECVERFDDLTRMIPPRSVAVARVEIGP